MEAGGRAVRTRAPHALTALVASTAAGCSGVQSTFTTFGAEAAEIRTLTFAMTAAAAVIAIAVLALAAYAVRAPENRLSHTSGMRLVLWLGGIGPTVLLAALLVFALPTMRALPTAADDLRIAVAGEQFWWRVRYLRPDGAPVETANEVRVPVGRTVAFELESPDVIHSFWIPGLAGKVDMIPGRVNELVVRATRSGVFRGTCAEFCGLSHALMAFDVVAMEPAEFDRWLQALAAPAEATQSAGRALFDEYGCNGCHAVRGHFLGSAIGPDLTHLGTRLTLAAGILPPSVEALAAFIRDPAAIKPGALMPPFERMTPADAEAIARYLLEQD